MAITIDIDTARPYQVHVGTFLLEQAGPLVRATAGGTRAVIVTDANVGPLYQMPVKQSLESAGYEVSIAPSRPARPISVPRPTLPFWSLWPSTSFRAPTRSWRSAAASWATWRALLPPPTRRAAASLCRFPQACSPWWIRRSAARRPSDLATDLAVLNCPPPVGTMDLTPNHWWWIFFYMHEDLMDSVKYSYNFKDWHYSGGEHFGEAIYVRHKAEKPIMDTTTYPILIHTPQP